MVKRSPCRSHAAVHGVDRVNDISELVQACRQGSLLHESSERHLLGNDDQSWVWPLPKVPWLHARSFAGWNLLCGCAARVTRRCNHTRCLVLTSHQTRRGYTVYSRHKHSPACHGPCPFNAGENWRRCARHDGLYHQLRA